LRNILGNTTWEDVYQKIEVEELPWFSSRLDRDIEKAISNLKIIKGTALDIGTGPGTQAIALAKLGFKVTAIDISETAVEKAGLRAFEKKAKVKFIRDNILNSKLVERFNFVIDRGCFHVIAPPKRKNYVSVVHNLVKARGYLFLKCFSHKEPPGRGPHRFTPDEIVELFDNQFKIVSIRESAFSGTLRHAPRALFSILKKK
jgi:2-polyprenyl-3-methyl-5-hydroxy-6-metoxy-1,4-benzoquinol methylase